jgi:hypothetical protein
MKGKDGGTRRKKRQIIVGETDRRDAMPCHHTMDCAAQCSLHDPMICGLLILKFYCQQRDLWFYF